MRPAIAFAALALAACDTTRSDAEIEDIAADVTADAIAQTDATPGMNLRINNLGDLTMENGVAISENEEEIERLEREISSLRRRIDDLEDEMRRLSYQ